LQVQGREYDRAREQEQAADTDTRRAFCTGMTEAYKNALAILSGHYDFIIHANDVKKCIYNELEHVIHVIKLMQKFVTPMSDPNDWTSSMEYDRFKDDMARMRHDAWEMGLTHTLFDKLADRDFQLRFRGFYENHPVVQEKIEDHYDDRK
jgi:hypothetical protein